MIFADQIVIRKVCASHIVDFKFPLEKILSIEYDIFEDVKLIDDELTKINSSWCEAVHFDMKHNNCFFHIVKGEDEGNNYLAERMGLFTQKKATLFDLHTKFKNIMDILAEKDNNLERDALNFFKAVFGIPSSNDYKNLVNNMNLLRDSQNGLVNDTQKLAKGLNLTQPVLCKHRAELDELHISMSRLKVGLNSINEEFLYLLQRSGISYVIAHIDYLLDRLAECEEIMCSQISQLHDILRVVTNGCITPSVVESKGN